MQIEITNIARGMEREGLVVCQRLLSMIVACSICSNAIQGRDNTGARETNTKEKRREDWLYPNLLLFSLALHLCRVTLPVLSRRCLLTARLDCRSARELGET